MSGHSHFHSIKHKKELEDKKRGKIFSKLSRVITVAAKEGGGDPDINPRLRMAIEKAKSFNMPKENIERAIKKGTGELASDKLEDFSFEAFGPGGIAVIIEGITDNKNRTLNEVKQILNQNKGKLASEGSVRWLFSRKGAVVIDFEAVKEKFSSKEVLELEIIDSGAEDFRWKEDAIFVYTSPEKLEEMKNNLKGKGIKIESSNLEWVAKEEISVGDKDKEVCLKLFNELEDSDDVQDIYSNLKE